MILDCPRCKEPLLALNHVSGDDLQCPRCKHKWQEFKTVTDPSDHWYVHEPPDEEQSLFEQELEERTLQTGASVSAPWVDTSVVDERLKVWVTDEYGRHESIYAPHPNIDCGAYTRRTKTLPEMAAKKNVKIRKDQGKRRGPNSRTNDPK